MTSPLATSIVFVALVLPAAAGPSIAANLDGGAIKRLFPGYFEAKVQGYTIHFMGLGNGRLKGEAYGREDRGRWFVKGDTLCVAWERWTKSQAKCGAIAQQAGWFVASDGEGEMLKFRRALVAEQ